MRPYNKSLAWAGYLSKTQNVYTGYFQEVKFGE